MESVTNRNFGILIAYLIPGFIALTGPLLHGSSAIRGGHVMVELWMGDFLQKLKPDSNLLSCFESTYVPPTIGGVLMVTLVALFFGLVISTFRWVIFDNLHHRTGIDQPTWDFRSLAQRIEGYQTMVEFHYRYYQFYANSIIARAFHYAFRWPEVKPIPVEMTLVLVVSIVLFMASRDCLRKYYERVARLLAD